MRERELGSHKPGLPPKSWYHQTTGCGSTHNFGSNPGFCRPHFQVHSNAPASHPFLCWQPGTFRDWTDSWQHENGGSQAWLQINYSLLTLVAHLQLPFSTTQRVSSASISMNLLLHSSFLLHSSSWPIPGSYITSHIFSCIPCYHCKSLAIQKLITVSSCYSCC